MKKTTRATSLTECVMPPALSEDELLDALDGIGQEKIQAHLDACEFCLARLDELQQLQENLLMLMYRSDCPSADKLADYVMSILITSDAGKLAEHLKICSHCQSEVDSLRSIIDPPLLPTNTGVEEEAVWQPILDFAKSLGAGIVSILKPETVTPDTVYRFKGTEKEGVLDFSDGSVTVMLRLEKVANSLKVSGDIVDMAEQERWSGSHIELVSSEEAYYMALIDENASFSFAKVDAGKYRLNVYRSSGSILRIEELELKFN